MKRNRKYKPTQTAPEIKQPEPVLLRPAIERTSKITIHNTMPEFKMDNAPTSKNTFAANDENPAVMFFSKDHKQQLEIFSNTDGAITSNAPVAFINTNKDKTHDISAEIINTSRITSTQLTIDAPIQTKDITASTLNIKELKFNGNSGITSIIPHIADEPRKYTIPDAGRDTDIITAHAIKPRILHGTTKADQLTTTTLTAEMITADKMTLGGRMLSLDGGSNGGGSTIALTSGNKTLQAGEFHLNKTRIIGHDQEAEYVLPNVGNKSQFVLADGAQTLHDKTLVGAIISGNIRAENPKNKITNTIQFSNISKTAIYTVPDAPGGAAFVMSTGNDKIESKQLTTGELLLTGGNSAITIIPEEMNFSHSRVYKIPDVGPTAKFIMSTGRQRMDQLNTTSIISDNATVGIIDIQGELRYKGARVKFATDETSGNFGGSGMCPSEVIMENNKSANVFQTPAYFKEFIALGNIQVFAAPGGVSKYTIPNVETSAQFLLNKGNQDIAGALGATSISAGTLTTNKTTIQGSNQAVSRISIPDIAARDNKFVLAAGDQSFQNVITFEDSARFTKPREQLKFGSGGEIIIDVDTGNTGGNTGSNTGGNTGGQITKYTVPHVSSGSKFIMSTGAQKIAGPLELSNALTITGGALINSVVGNISTYISIEGQTTTANYAIPNTGATHAKFIMSAGATPQKIIGGLCVDDLEIGGRLKVGDNTLIFAPNKKPTDLHIPSCNTGAGSGAALIISNPASAQRISGDITLESVTHTKAPRITADRVSFTIGKSAIDLVISEPMTGGAHAYTIPDTGAQNSRFIMSDGKQKINGELTIGRPLIVDVAPDEPILQIARNGAPTARILAPGTSKTEYTIPDTGTHAKFIMSEGMQTIRGGLSMKTMRAAELTITDPATGADNIIIDFTRGTTGNKPIKYTVPNVSTDARFILSHGERTLNDITRITAPIVSMPSDTKSEHIEHLHLMHGKSGVIIATEASLNGRVNKYVIPDVGMPTRFIMAHGDHVMSGKLACAQLDTATIKLANSTIVPENTTAATKYTLPAVTDTTTAIITAHGKQTIYGQKIFRAVDIVGDLSISHEQTGAQVKIRTHRNNISTFTLPNIEDSEFVMTAGAQTIRGIKTFTDAPTIGRNTLGAASLIFGEKQSLVITAANTTAHTYTIPEVGADAKFIMSEGSQEVRGHKIFAQPIAITSPGKQLILNAGQSMVAIGATTHNDPRTYTINDAGRDAAFVMSAGKQYIESLTIPGGLEVSKITGEKIEVEGVLHTRALITHAVNTSLIKSATSLMVTAPDVSMQKVTLMGNSGSGALEFRADGKYARIIAEPNNNIFAIPKTDADAQFVMTAGDQKISGKKAFSALELTQEDKTAAPLTIGTRDHKIEVFVGPLTGNRKYIIPDFGSDGVFSIVAPDPYGGLRTVGSKSTTYDIANVELPASSMLAGNIRKGGKVIFHDFSNIKDSPNLFIGHGAGNFSLQSSSENIGIGSNTLSNITTANKCTALGNNALMSVTSGSNNMAIGYNASRAITTGVYNITIGNGAGVNLTDGAYNILIGPDSGDALTVENGNIYIGANGISGENNTIRIGETATKCHIGGIYGSGLNSPSVVYMNSSGQLGTMLSSARFKKNIETVRNGLNIINRLNPVKFTYKNDKTNSPNFGLIAEEVANVIPELVVYDKDNMPETVQYHALDALVLSAIQEQSRIIADLKKELAEMRELLKK